MVFFVKGTSSHHRYNSDKHGSGGGYVGGGQEKSRGHLYGSSGSSQHVLKEDRDDTASPASRERKGRWALIGAYATPQLVCLCCVQGDVCVWSYCMYTYVC